MQINLTKSAHERLLQLADPKTTGLKLIYDTDGCGCAVNGIAQVLKVSRTLPEEGEAFMAERPFAFFYETRQEVFFEDQMTLDYSPAAGSFILKSDNQFYNPALTI